MKKIPTLFLRDPDDMSKVTDEVHPDCQWVLDGEGTATRKYDGTCVALIQGIGWVARREVKPGKQPPEQWHPVEHDDVTGKTVGWEPIHQSPFYKFWKEATDAGDGNEFGTYELCGPKVNGNPEGYERHTLVLHADAEVDASPMEPKSLVLANAELGWEGIVWHHPDGRMAKLKMRDLR